MTRQTSDYLIHLIRSVLHSEKPEEKPVEVSFEQVYELAKFHCVEGIAFYGIEQLTVKPDHQLFEEWKANRDGNIIKTFNQLAELDKISERLTSKNIKHIPLKGSVLIYDYPQLDYRYLGDLDILVDSEDADQLKSILEEFGFVAEDFGNSYHDTYVSDRTFYKLIVEIHRQLFDEKVEYENYFDEPALLNTGEDYRVLMTLEDFYLYMIAHFAKHFFSSGSGIRSIMDLYVFLNKHSKDLKWDVINEGLEQLELVEFDSSARKLAYIWFDEVLWDPELEQIAEAIISQGAYGTFENRVDNNLNSYLNDSDSTFLGKLNYFGSRIFVEPRFIKRGYNYVKKYPILLPIGWGHRLIDAVWKRRSRVMFEIKALLSFKNRK